MTKTEEPTAREREVFAADQRVERLRAEIELAEHRLCMLKDGRDLEKPKTERVVFTFQEPVIALNLTLTPSQLDLLSTMFRVNGIHGTLHKYGQRSSERVARNA